MGMACVPIVCHRIVNCTVEEAEVSQPPFHILLEGNAMLSFMGWSLPKVFWMITRPMLTSVFCTRSSPVNLPVHVSLFGVMINGKSRPMICTVT
jgi:hypothetical protein